MGIPYIVGTSETGTTGTLRATNECFVAKWVHLLLETYHMPVES